MKRRMCTSTILCLLLSIGLLGDLRPARAEPLPDQVVILANAKSPESLAVAKHYAVRRALEAAHLASTAKVIVTTYGVPIRIEAPVLSEDENRWLAEAQSLVKTSRARLEQFALLREAEQGIQKPGD